MYQAMSVIAACAICSSAAVAETVRVESGQTLYTIAQNKLGNGSKWREICALNRETLGPNCDRVYPGMVLTLPGDAPAAPETSEATAEQTGNSDAFDDIVTAAVEEAMQKVDAEAASAESERPEEQSPLRPMVRPGSAQSPSRNADVSGDAEPDPITDAQTDAALSGDRTTTDPLIPQASAETIVDRGASSEQSCQEGPLTRVSRIQFAEAEGHALISSGVALQERAELRSESRFDQQFALILTKGNDRERLVVDAAKLQRRQGGEYVVAVDISNTERGYPQNTPDQVEIELLSGNVLDIEVWLCPVSLKIEFEG